MFYDNLRHFIVDSAKLPAMVLAWENFQEVFVMLVVVAVVFTSLEVFHFIAFRRHSSSFRELVRVLRFSVGVFLLTGVFYPTLLGLWLRWEQQEHPIQDLPVPALTELSLPVDAWTLTIDAWISRPFIYQLCQWATKYRVKIELLNMFCLFKAYVKTIKKHFKEDL